MDAKHVFGNQETTAALAGIDPMRLLGRRSAATTIVLSADSDQPVSPDLDRYKRLRGRWRSRLQRLGFVELNVTCTKCVFSPPLTFTPPCTMLVNQAFLCFLVVRH